SPDANRRNIAGEGTMTHIGREGETVNALHPGREAGHAFDELHAGSEIGMLGLRILDLTFGHEAVAPEKDMPLQCSQLRPLTPIDRETGRQNEEIEDEPAARGVEQHAIIPDLDCLRRRARKNGEVLMPGYA